MLVATMETGFNLKVWVYLRHQDNFKTILR
jgi:hypothetical protein